MHIVIVTDWAHPEGGAEKVGLDSALGLAQAGHNVVLFSGTGEPPAALRDHTHIRIVLAGATAVRDYPSKLQKLRHSLWNKETAATMAGVLDGLPAADTVVHAHSYMTVLTPSVLDVALDRGLPLVVTGHDYGLACPAMGFFHYGTYDICHLNPMGVRCLLTDCSTKGFATKWGLSARLGMARWRAGIPKRMAALVAVSQGSADILRPFLPGVPITLIRNPIDIQRPAQPVHAASNEAFGFVGRLTPEKDPAFFVATAAKAGVPALVAGDGPERDKAEAANPAAEFLGQVGRDGIENAFQRMRALVMTSRWYEAAPLVINEAHARGIPVILPDTCAGKDAVVDGETGLYFRGGDQDDLIRAFRTLQDDATCTRMSQAAYERFWANAQTMERHVDQLVKLYRSVLKSPSPAPAASR